MKKTAFTLVEMVIVIVIMGVIALFSIGGLGNQMRKLQEKITKENFLSNYQKIYSSNLTSSYKNGKIYTGLIIEIASGGNGFLSTYIPTMTEYDASKFSDHNIVINSILSPSSTTYYDGTSIITWTGLPSATISLTPYKLNCSINKNPATRQLLLITTIRNRKEVCFIINSDLCRLIEIPCPPPIPITIEEGGLRPN